MASVIRSEIPKLAGTSPFLLRNIMDNSDQKACFMTVHRFARATRNAALGLAALSLALPFLATAARADCNEDLAALAKKRQAQMDDLNRLAKASKGGQLDPIASCPKFRALVAAEQAFLAYVTKNKEWCGLPNDAVENIGASAKRSQTIAGQACKIAAQAKKQQESGGLGAAPAMRLPAGPL
jgi:hypothetical protein